HLNGFQHVPARQVDGGGPFKFQVDVGPLGGDQGVDHPVHVAACQVMGLQLVDGQIDAGFGGLNQGHNDLGGDYPPQAHTNQGADAYVDVGRHGRDPQRHRDKAEKQGQQNDNNCRNDNPSE